MRELILENIKKYWEEKTQAKPFIPSKTIVPVSGAVIDTNDIVTVADALLDGWFTEWKYASKFSKNLAEYVGVKHAILCNSGSSANLLAILACIEKYSRNKKLYKIITCGTGFPTTVAPIIQTQHIPLFVDINLQTLNVDVDDLMDCLEDDTVAGIIVAHNLGIPIELVGSIRANCDALGKFFIEDCCDALGGINEFGRPLGSIGNISTCSFFPAHQITTGEGGAVFTDDDELAELARCYSEWGRGCFCKPGQSNTCGKRFSQNYPNMPPGYDHKYTFILPGYNLKMTELSAALGYSQIQKLDRFVQLRKLNYNYLYKNLKSLYDADKIHIIFPNPNASPFGFPIVVNEEISNKRDLVAFLEERNIRTRPVFAGNITRQPMMDDVYYETYLDLSNSDYVMNNAFWVGCHPQLNREMLDWTIESIQDFFGR